MLTLLPNGLLDGQDLFNYVDLDELRGKDQDYLADKDLVIGNIGHIPKILENKILSLQTKEGLQWKGKISDAVWKLTSGDIETILIKIREYTYGARFYHEAKCTECGEDNKNLRLDLDQLALTIMPVEEMVKPKVSVLPKMGVEVELKPLYLKDLFEVIKIANNKKDKLITSLATVSLKRIGTNTNVTAEDVGKLSVIDLQHIQEDLDKIKLDGSIDTDIQVECTKCKKEFTVKLNCYDSSFFTPSRGYTT